MVTEHLSEKSVFNIARRIESREARADYLHQVCGDDPDTMRRVAELLRVHEQEKSFLESPAVALTATIDTPPLSERPGQTIGRYKLLEEIGEGGMGVVYLAEQREPVRRKVALKIIKPGMDTREVIARFEAERQALAMMDHPNIARIFDGGATESGRPYFVMERVVGLPITDYCDRANLTTRDRLALFVLVCQAVQHAHQKGIIHRDIKPSNVLVMLHDDVPVPKVIDFGVAKAIHQPLTDKSLFTGQGRMVGTPLYMSPEQADMSGLDVDTRSDIYSLGVLLYELLTGSTPFDRERMREAGFDEVRRVIREEEPPRPSHRVSTLAAEAMSTVTAHRGVDARILGRLLSGDLDLIVMKALQKDRTQRYESASALAADVQRHLADEPVQARPPTLAHHAAKWVRRHRSLVWSVTTIVVLFALTAGTIAGSGYRRAAALEKDVSGHLAAAAALLEAADYAAAGREVLESRAHLETGGYGDGPLSEEAQRIADLLSAKTRSFERLDEFQRLRHRIHSEMYAVDRTILDQAQSHCRTALDLYEAMQRDSWKQQQGFRDLSPAQQATLEEGVVELLFVWARLEIGRSDELSAAERPAALRQSVEALARIQSFHTPIQAVYLWIADCWDTAGDKKAASEARAKAEAIRPTTAMDHFLLGEYQTRHGRQDQGLACYGEALSQQPDHYLSLLASGVALGDLKEHKSAEAMLTGAIAMNPQTVLAYAKRGISRLEQGKILLAQADFQQAKKLDPELARALTRRAITYRENYEFDKALADCNEAIRLDPKSALAHVQRSVLHCIAGNLDAALADSTEAIRLEPQSASFHEVRAEVYHSKGQADKAMADINECLRLDPNFAWGYRARSRLYREKGELEKAQADITQALRLEPKNGSILAERGVFHRARGERDKALADFDEAIRLDPKQVWTFAERAALHLEKGDFSKAVADNNEAVRLAPKMADAYFWRAATYRTKGDFDKALADYSDAIRLNPKNAGVYCDRADLYRARDDFDKALADISEAIRLSPKDIRPYIMRSKVHRDRGDFDKALADSNEAIRLAPKDTSAYVSRADTYLAMRQLDKGLADMNEAIRLGPTFPAGEYGHRGHFHRELGDFDKALADYSEAIRLSPQFLGAYVVRADLYASKGEFGKAAADYDRAASLGAMSWHFYKRGAAAHFQLKHYDKALACIAKAVELMPGDTSNLLWIPPEQLAKCTDERLRKGLLELADKTIEKTNNSADAYLARAVLYDAFGRRDAAIADFDKVVALRQEQTAVWYFRALARLGRGQAEEYRKGCAEMLKRFGQTTKADDAHWVVWTCAVTPDATKDWPKAVALAKMATKSDPNSATYLNTFGAALYRAGRWEEAVQRLTEADRLAQQPGGSDMSSPAYPWFFLAMAHHRLGHRDDAKKWLDKAVAWTEKAFREGDQGVEFLPWNRSLTLKLLRDEAEALLKSAPPSKPAAKEKEKPKIAK